MTLTSSLPLQAPHFCVPQLFRSPSLTKDSLSPDDSNAALHAPTPQFLYFPSGLHLTARPSLPQPSRSSGDIFRPGLAQAPPPRTSSIHTSPAPTHWSQVTRAQVQRPPPSPRVLPRSPLPRPSSRSRCRHARAPAGPRSLASPTPPLGNSPALLSKPPSQRAHLSTRARGLPRAHHARVHTPYHTRVPLSPRAGAYLPSPVHALPHTRAPPPLTSRAALPARGPKRWRPAVTSFPALQKLGGLQQALHVDHSHPLHGLRAPAPRRQEAPQTATVPRHSGTCAAGGRASSAPARRALRSPSRARRARRAACSPRAVCLLLRASTGEGPEQR